MSISSLSDAEIERQRQAFIKKLIEIVRESDKKTPDVTKNTWRH